MVGAEGKKRHRGQDHTQIIQPLIGIQHTGSPAAELPDFKRPEKLWRTAKAMVIA